MLHNLATRPLRPLTLVGLLSLPLLGLAQNGIAPDSEQVKEFAGRRYCTTVECMRASMAMFGSMARRLDEVNPCEDWDTFACGNYDKQMMLESDLGASEVEVNTLVVLRAYVTALLDKAVGNPWDPDRSEPRPENADEVTFDRMREYYSTCMDTTALNKAGLTPLKRITHPLGVMWKQSEGLWDQDTGFSGDSRGYPTDPPYATLPMGEADRKQTGWATAQLAKYGLWAFVRMEVKQSLFNTSENRIRIEPYFAPGLPRAEMYNDDNMFDAYQTAAGKILKDLHRQQWIMNPWPSRNLAVTLAGEVIHFEHATFNVTANAEERAPDAANAVVWTRQELERHIPELGIQWAVEFMGVQDLDKLDQVEVLQPEYLIRLSELISRTPRKAVRGFFILKAFQQTWELLAGDTQHEYANFQKKVTGMAKSPDLMTRCKGQTSKHFGPIISAVFLSATIPPEVAPMTMNMFDSIQDVLGDVINDTEWMDVRTKQIALTKLAGSRALLGFQTESPNLLDWKELKLMYAEARVDAGNLSEWWTHADDYFRLEEMHIGRQWKFDLSKEPRRNVWELNAHDVDSYYSRQQNRVVIPAALMQEPMFHPGLPSYVNYGALGTTMATELMHGFDKTGFHFSANGTLDPWVTGRNEQRLNAAMQCFDDKYDGMNVADNRGRNLTLDASARMDCILADTTAIDVTFKAYKRANASDLMLPGFHRFTDDQMFFLFRSLPYCSKERPDLLPNELARGSKLPNRVRSWKPLEDSLSWHRAFGCKPKANVCSLYGRHQTKLEFLEVNQDIRTKLDYETHIAWITYQDNLRTEEKEKAKKEEEEKRKQDKEKKKQDEEEEKEEEKRKEEFKKEAEQKKKEKEEMEKKQEAKEKAAKEALEEKEKKEKEAEEKAKKQKEKEEKAAREAREKELEEEDLEAKEEKEAEEEEKKEREEEEKKEREEAKKKEEEEKKKEEEAEEDK